MNQEMTAQLKSAEHEILCLALRITQNALDDLVTACLKGPPSKSDIINARKHLVSWCDNALTKDKA